MYKEDFAELLNNRPFINTISLEEGKLAKDNDLLVCFCESEDLLELRGIIDEEIYLHFFKRGSSFLVKKKNNGIGVISKDEIDNIQHLIDTCDLDINIKTLEIKAIRKYKELENVSLINTDVPHATFNIIRYGKLFCQGIVINKSDILNYFNN